MKKILVVHTGGTIAMQEDEHGTSLQQVNPLSRTTNSLLDIADVIVDDYITIPSPHMTPSRMIDLAKRIESKLETEQLDGVVITHGTDTLEETAYLLDLLLDTNQPVILTGAMRSSNEVSADGPHNLISAVRVAACNEARGQGVLVVFNDEIHTAKNATKTHTSNIATFQSPQYGPLGIVTKRGVFFHHTLTKRENYQVSQLTKNVVLLKAYAGMDASIIEAVSRDIDGLVIEAFGQGNVPPAIVPALKKLIAQNIPVVFVSRCFNGIVEDIYAYEGGGKQLKEQGVIFTNGLNGQKARLKLLVVLEQTNDPVTLQQMFMNA